MEFGRTTPKRGPYRVRCPKESRSVHPADAGHSYPMLMDIKGTNN